MTCLNTLHLGFLMWLERSSRCRFLFVSTSTSSVLEILVFQLRVVFGTAQPEMGSGVVLASILLPTELLIAFWRRDSLCSFPTSIIPRFQERESFFEQAQPQLWMNDLMALTLIKSSQLLIIYRVLPWVTEHQLSSVVVQSGTPFCLPGSFHSEHQNGVNLVIWTSKLENVILWHLLTLKFKVT